MPAVRFEHSRIPYSDLFRISDFGFRISFCLALVLTLLATPARAQSSSLLGDPQRRTGLSMASCSWTFQPPPPPKEIKLHDQITIVVKMTSVVTSEGEVDRRKKAKLDAILKEWALLDGFSLVPDPQSAGEPAVKGSWENQYRAESELETRDSMTFSIAVNVVDIRPNGLLVVEGRQTIRNNEETWERCLSGLVRPEDITPNNTVQSDNVSELQIYKRESGHVRDGYRRGWLLEVLDKFQPF